MKLAMVFPGQGSQSVGMLQAYAGLPEVDDVRSTAFTWRKDPDGQWRCVVDIWNDPPASAPAKPVTE